MTKVEAFAPAKINLALHVIGQRQDGYHLLDSLVCFAGIGDAITARSAAGLSLGASGPFGAAVPLDASNLVLRAAELMLGEARRHGRRVAGAAIQLEKRLPVAAGIGGGSSDAAATCRALSALWGVPVPGPERLVAALGADVPVCMAPEGPQRMEGVGEKVSPVAPLPPLNLLLVNPGFGLNTADIFRHLADKRQPAMAGLPEPGSGLQQLVEWLTWQRNDLQDAAVALAPEIGVVLEEIASMEGCLLARMSGSGATCFGIFSDPEARDRAAGVLRGENEAWWVAEG